MKLLSNQTDKFNELVFEHRNKNYGAYVIRKSYSSAVIKSCIITFSAVALLLGSAIVANNLNSRPELVIIPKTEPIYDTLDMNLKDPSANDPKPVVEQKTTAAAATNTGLNLTVVDQTVAATPSVSIENPVEGRGDPNATGTSTTSVETTTNTTTTGGGGGGEEHVDTVGIAQEMPEYEGGIKALTRFLGSNMIYPEQAKAMGREGKVYISFIVDENGYVTGAKVLRGIGYGCDEEALRVVNKLPKWKKPGKNGGRHVRVRFNLPISFTLQ